MDQWLKENLVCPRDYSGLHLSADNLVCSGNHVYPIIDGIPVMLLNEVAPTHFSIVTTLERGCALASQEFKRTTEQSNGTDVEPTDIHPYVQKSIVDSCGNLYAPLINKLARYPIPMLRLPQGSGELFLDIGCNWGRWSVAAARKGYSVVSIDSSLEAILAARKVSHQLGVSPRYIVADARYLPFRSNSFDIVFSYSVLQHFSKENVEITLRAIARVLKAQGTSLIQMANIYGIRCLYHQLKRRFSEQKEFEVNWWSLPEMKSIFTKAIGETALSVDGYFGLGVQKSDIDLLPLKYRLVVRSSELLRWTSEKARWMKFFADSIYVKSRRITPG